MARRSRSLILAISVTLAAVALLALPASGGAAVTTFSTGGLFTCAAISDGTVRCFGDNVYGQLGNDVNRGDGLAPGQPVPQLIQLGAPAKKLVSGYAHTCALLTDNTVRCWGYNPNGQTGSTVGAGVGGLFTDPLDQAHTFPQTVPLPATPVDITVGDYHSCAALVGGAVYCWGDNYWGQLGVPDDVGVGGGFSAPIPHVTPLASQISGNTRDIEADGYSTCAISDTNVLRCLGLNHYGQLGHAFGIGPPPTAQSQTVVNLGSGVTAQSAALGYEHTCVISSTPALLCFGNNRYGRLGNNSNLDDNAAHDSPTAVASLAAAPVQVDGAYAHTCALEAGGIVQCWGNNQSGEMGDSTGIGGPVGSNHPVPFTVPLAGPASEVHTGGAHTCALLVSGDLQCWGNNTRGQTGRTDTGPDPTPTSVGGLDPIVPPPGATKQSFKFGKPRLKRKLRRGKLLITGTIIVPINGLTAATCSGRVALTLRVKKKRLAAKSFALRFAKQRCSAKVSWKLAKKHRGKRARLTTALTGSTTLSAPSRTDAQKL